MLAEGDGILPHVFPVMARHDHLACAALLRTEAHDAVDFRHHCRVVRAARLEQFGDTRQTAGDVTRLADVARNADQDGPRGDLLPVVHREVRPGGDDVAAQLVPLGVGDHQARHQRPVT